MVLLWVVFATMVFRTLKKLSRHGRLPLMRMNFLEDLNNVLMVLDRSIEFAEGLGDRKSR